MTLLPPFDQNLAVLLVCVLVAGVAKGLSGFGTGMIVAPVAGALYGPPAAVAIIVIIDSLPSVPVTVAAIPHARWKEVIPVALGLFVTVPLGVFVLKNGDPEILRWTISTAILCCVCALWSGWRYAGPRNAGVSLGVGAVAGLLSGIAAIPGPPVIVYWIASGYAAAAVRANLLTLFLIGTVASVGNLWLAELFPAETVMLALAAAPVYFVGILAGWRLFGLASERAYRLATYALIVAAAILALPVMDGALRALAP